jgi:hypothetical protein
VLEWICQWGPPLLGGLDLLLGIGAAFLLFRRWGNTLAEAGIYAVVVTLMVLSLILEVATIPESIWLVRGIEVVFGMAAAGTLIRGRQKLLRTLGNLPKAIHLPRPALIVLLLLWGYLFFLAVGSSPSPSPCLDEILPVGATIGVECCSLPTQHRLLLGLFLNNGHLYGAGLLGLTAYAALCLGTYTLARRYAWPPTALTVALIPAAMPRLVYLARGAGCEIVPAAVLLFCLVALYRTVEYPNPRDFALLLTGIAFSIGMNALSVAMAAILLALSALLLYRRHGAVTWQTMVLQNPLAVAAAALTLLIYSNLWRKVLTLPPGPFNMGRMPSHTPPLNNDGLVGGAANLVRYLVQSLHVTQPVDHLLHWMFGIRLQERLNWIYLHFGEPHWGQKGAATAFAVDWSPTGPSAGFGPFAALVILPAVFYIVLRGPRRLKAVAVALVGYLYMVTLIPAWQPGNLRLLTPFFTGGAFMSAFVLPPWYITTRRRALLQVLNLALLAYALISQPRWFVLG